MIVFIFSSKRRHARCGRDWNSDVCSSDLPELPDVRDVAAQGREQALCAECAEEGRVVRVDIAEFDRCGEIGRASCRKSVDRGGRRNIEKKKKNMKSIV